jgi:hypothetical protein
MQRASIAEVDATARPAPLWNTAAPGWAFSELAQFAVRVLAWLLALAVILVAWRRLAGALPQPPHPSLLLAAGMIAAALTVLIRAALRSTVNTPSTSPTGWAGLSSFILHPSSFILSLSSFLLLTTFAAALSFAATPLPVRLAFWGVLILEEAWALWPAGRKAGRGLLPKRPDRVVAEPPPGATGGSPAAGATGFASAAVARADELHGAPGEVVQQLTRSRAADGSELLEGFLRLAFAPMQRTAIAHVAFCPPFPRVPRLEVRQLDGPAARVKTAQLLPYGVRLDLKLVVAAETSLAVLLQFSARSAPSDLDGRDI